MADKIYCYPNSDVLINKLGIKDEETLAQTERDITSANKYILDDSPIKGSFDITHLKAVHEHLFKDLYPWAGEFRTVDIQKGPTYFGYAQNIDSYLKDVLNKVKNENYLVGVSKSAMPERLAHYFGEINAMHPFREGNGRCQRAYTEMLAKVAGYSIDFSKITEEQMLKASYLSVHRSNDELEKIFGQVIEPISREEQLAFARKVLPPNDRVLKALESVAARESGQKDVQEKNDSPESKHLSMTDWKRDISAMKDKDIIGDGNKIIEKGLKGKFDR